MNLMNIKQASRKIRKFFNLHKRMPSYREICSLFGFASKKAAFDLAKKLIKAGILEKDSQGKLIPKNLFPPLPWLGIIPAGPPSYQDQQILENIILDQHLINNPEKAYMLKVFGDSMIDAGIFPDDLVIVEKTPHPNEGDIVVAFIDNEFTLKYLKRKNNKIYLLSANKKYPVFYPSQSLEIFGKVVSVIRKYK